MELQEQKKNMTIESGHQEKMTETPAKISFKSCPICHGGGWEYYIDSEGREMGRECSCGALRIRAHNKLLAFANIPESFANVKLENFKKTVYQNPESQEKIVEAAKAVRYWLKNFDDMKKRGIGMYFYSGTKGSGKTRLAISVANELINKYNILVKFTTSLKILEEIKQSWSKKKDETDETENKLISALSTTDVLIIDDFGTEQYKNWIDDKFNSIINGRYNDKKITIFTSNMSIDDLPYDTRITSRVKERSLQIPFPEESVRETLSWQLQEELKKAIDEN